MPHPMPPMPMPAPRSAHSPLARRADPHVRAGHWRLALALVVGPWLAACDGSQGAGPAPEELDSLTLTARGLELPAATARGEAAVDRLVAALTPLDPTLTSDHHDRWLHAGRALREELRAGDPEIGVAALRRLRDADVRNPLVRRGLLEVGAHTAPDIARPILIRLIDEYGHDYAVRTFAVEFLAETSPAAALELLEPYLKKRGKPNKTMPPDEFLVRGYATAARKTGVDPTLILSDVATNLWMEDAARHFAVQELGTYPGPYARSVLEAILIESTGNAYVRRKAAQALRDSAPAESACEVFRRVAEREADGNMLAFLLDMLRENCE